MAGVCSTPEPADDRTSASYHFNDLRIRLTSTTKSPLLRVATRVNCWVREIFHAPLRAFFIFYQVYRVLFPLFMPFRAFQRF